MDNLTFEEICNDSFWELRFISWKATGKYTDLKKMIDSSHDTVIFFAPLAPDKQPRKLREFWSEYFEAENKTMLTRLKNFYDGL